MPLPNPSPPPSRLGLALNFVLLVALIGAWMFWRSEREPLPEAAGPVLDVPRQQAPPAPRPVESPPTGAQAPPPGDAQVDDGAAPEQAYEPALSSSDSNLSFARRAGLHRAANPLQLTASAALAVDATSGDVVYGRNEQAILPIASLTKLLAGIVLLEAKLPMSQRIRITRDDVDTLRYSRSRLRVGTSLTRSEALRLALMSSENRAAHALARTYPGGVPAFVAQMNHKAAQLGMDHSRFVDPTGLSNQNRATAGNVATLVVAASKYPLLRSYSTTRRHVAVFGSRRLQYLNSNRLVRQSGWTIQLQKTGYIVEAGQCLAMLTRVRGRPVVLVLLDAGSFATRTEDARRLQRWTARRLAAAPAASRPAR